MKKIILTFYLLLFGIIGISAETINVEFNDCVDGDTAKFIYNEETITARFLAIDTPETKHPTKGIEPYGIEASEYTCNRLKNAENIELEYDDDSDKLDKYNRHLVWVFVDGNLLQEELVSKGFASVAYLYGNYKYTEILEDALKDAENNKLGIWSIQENSEETNQDNKTLYNENKEKIDYKEIIILLGIIIILCMFSTKYRKKVRRKFKSEIKKRLK